MPITRLLVVGLLVGCTTTSDVPVPRFYEYWQRSPNGVGTMGTPTKWYRELFATRGPQRKFWDAMDRDFYDAARGDLSALHRFLHNPYRDAEGEFGEIWVADMVVLALVYGDAGLYSALQSEPRNVREAVGITIEEEMPQDRASFVHARTLYKFRKAPSPNQALERTADRREDLLSMTSTLKLEVELALVSGRSACSR